MEKLKVIVWNGKEKRHRGYAVELTINRDELAKELTRRAAASKKRICKNSLRSHQS